MTVVRARNLASHSNLIDRPLFLDPYNVAQGWEGMLNYDLTKTWSLQGRVYAGNTVTGADADTVWTASLKKVISDNVTACLTYGRRTLAVPTTISPTDSLQMLRLGLEFTL